MCLFVCAGMCMSIVTWVMYMCTYTDMGMYRYVYV